MSPVRVLCVERGGCVLISRHSFIKRK